MSVSILPDAEARRAAATDFSRNLVVVAGAGTGKTSLLVERALTALGSGRIEVEHLAAITFTEKAAGEMRTRLATGLERLRGLACEETMTVEETAADRALGNLRDAGLTPDEIAGRALDALRGFDRARVTTIHAFCAELLRDHPPEARVASDFEVDDGEHAEVLLDREWAEFLQGELGADAPRPDLWGRLLPRVGLDHVRALARRLASFDMPPELVDPDRPAITAQEIFGRESDALAGSIEDLLAREKGMKPWKEEFLGASARALRSLAEGGLSSP